MFYSDDCSHQCCTSLCPYFAQWQKQQEEDRKKAQAEWEAQQKAEKEKNFRVVHSDDMMRVGFLSGVPCWEIVSVSPLAIWMSRNQPRPWMDTDEKLLAEYFSFIQEGTRYLVSQGITNPESMED